MTDIAMIVVSGGIGCIAYLLAGWRGVACAVVVNFVMGLAVAHF
jgi:hypothetical protein